MKTKLITLSLLLAVIGGVSWYSYTSTPQHSLTLLSQAVKARDYEGARYFVDEERMSETLAKSFVHAAMSDSLNQYKSATKDNPFSGLGAAMIQMMEPTMREIASAQAKDAIKQALQGRTDLKFSELHLKQCRVQGDVAALIVVLPPNDFQLTEIHLQMIRIPNSRHWRIVEIPDAGDALTKLLNGRHAVTP